MEDNKNLILGSIAIIAVVLVALILFLPKDGKNETEIKIDDVKVYIHHEKTEEVEGYYSECVIPTEDLVKIRNEYNKISQLGNDNIASKKNINGDYKVAVGEYYIAFDKKHDNTVYYNKSNALFEYKSDIYDSIVKYCEK